jgi:hypothetical protein
VGIAGEDIGWCVFHAAPEDSKDNLRWRRFDSAYLTYSTRLRSSCSTRRSHKSSNKHFLAAYCNDY